MPNNSEQKMRSPDLHEAEAEALARWYEELAGNAMRAGDPGLCTLHEKRAAELRITAGSHTVRAIVPAHLEDDLLWELIEELAFLPVGIGSG